MDLVKLTIDGRAVEVPAGTTIYKAAKELGIDIPILCYMDLKDLNIENKPGGCRICVVEVEGRGNLASSCSTDVASGMVVKTNSMRVINARRTVMELILSDHPKDCLSCAKSGNCDLQDMAVTLGIREIPGQEYAEMSTYKTDFSPSIIRDLDKCIMCRRCEMMCNDFQTVGALSAFHRGFEAAVG
ncbi:MAG: (2Fe-2S)-binding protein, partial [Bacteroidales bacterium]|nr:(2Fe-2S)-binding protein [Bacteroidales bacterium]